MAFIAELHSVCKTMENGNIEFSWIDTEYNGVDIMPKVRQQEEDSCVFHAICAGAEMAIKRDAASKKPPKTSDIEFNTSSFVEEYENRINCKLGEESKLNLPNDVREETALDMFRYTGVLATSTDWEGEQRVKSRSTKQRQPLFDKIANLIRLAKPVVGSFRADDLLQLLGPDEIYEYFGPRDGIIDHSHMVLFVGYGFQGGLKGDRYLVFLNSDGVEFGYKGFGRVYFDDLYTTCLYVLNADVPRVSIQNLTSSSRKREPTQDFDDRPAQRQRLGGDGSSSSAGRKHPSTLQGDD